MKQAPSTRDAVHAFLLSLLSRKFLLTLIGMLFFGLKGQYVEALGIALGFMGVEGYADIRERMASGHE